MEEDQREGQEENQTEDDAKREWFADSYYEKAYIEYMPVKFLVC